MKLHIQNLGPIKKGELDLSKRFSVFVGYNNSGKTYAAQLLWGIFDNTHLDFSFDVEKIINDLPTKITLTQSLLNEITRFSTKKFDKVHLASLLGVSQDHISIKFFKGLFKQNLNQVLSLNFNQIIIEHFEEKSTVYRLKKEANSFDILITKQEYNSKIINEKSSTSLYIDYQVYEEEYKRVLYYLFSAIERYILNLTTSPFFLPANRSFYPSFYKYIYSIAKEEKDKINAELRNGQNLERIKALSKHPYTKPIDELIQSLFYLDIHRKANDYDHDLLLELQELLGGEISIKQSEGIAPTEFALKMNNGEILDMHLASSSINQLTLLYLYFKYWAKESNNTLIIDEPEENLHPKHQVALLNILMKFANRNNNRVIITTHSQLLTDAVNNHIYLGILKEQGVNVNEIIEANNLDITPSENLKEKDFGVYFFDGESIKPYHVGEYGVFFRDFKQEAKNVSQTATILKDQIYNNKRKKDSA